MASNNPIQTFYSTAQNRDFARLFQFRLVSFPGIKFTDEHYVYVESASIPGRSITNIPITYMGLDFNTPGTVKYPGSTGYNVTFRCDADYNIRAALEAATFNLFDEGSSRGTYAMPGTDQILVMELFDKNMATVRTYTLMGAWVQAIGDTAYDVKDGGTVQTVQATLAYQFWRPGDTAAETNPRAKGITKGIRVTGQNIDLPGFQAKRVSRIPRATEIL